MAKLSVLAILCAALVLSACIGGGSSSDDGPSADFVAAAEQAASDSLLTLNDLPAGWAAEPQDDDDDTDPEFTGECAFFNEDELEGQVATAESDKFTGPDGQVVYTNATALASAADTDAAMDLVATFVETCGGQLEEILRTAYRESFVEAGASEDEAATIEVSIEEFPFQQIGTRTATYRVDWTATVDEIPIGGTVDFVIWSEEMLIGDMVYLKNGPSADPADQTLIAGIFAEKVAQADAALSQAAATAR